MAQSVRQHEIDDLVPRVVSALDADRLDTMANDYDEQASGIQSFRGEDADQENSQRARAATRLSSKICNVLVERGFGDEDYSARIEIELDSDEFGILNEARRFRVPVQARSEED